MDTAQKILFGAAVLTLLYSVGGLIATWLAPRLQNTWLYNPRSLTGSLEANDVNRTLVSLFAIAAGATLGVFDVRALATRLRRIRAAGHPRGPETEICAAALRCLTIPSNPTLPRSDP